MRQVPNWKDYFLNLAEAASARSKDPSTNVGCLIVDPASKAIRSVGYNGFVSGVDETPELWERPAKYANVCHAEANAICHAARNGISTNGCHLYTTCFPCLACAKLIIQAGILHVCVQPGRVASGYKDEFDAALALFTQAEVHIDYHIEFVP